MKGKMLLLGSRRRAIVTMGLTVLISAAVGGASLGATVGAAGPTFTADAANGKLIFDAWGGCLYHEAPCRLSISPQSPVADIWAVEPDGTGMVNLTRSPGVDADGKWSPDGSKIAFMSNRSGTYQVFSMNGDGSGVTQLTDLPQPVWPGYPAWSPDGEWISYATTIGRHVEVRVMRPDGSRTRTIARLPYAAELDWSPDGKWVAFTADARDGDNPRIMLMRSDGSRLRRFPGTDRGDLSPSWSPDGRRIAFDRCTTRGPCDRDVYTIRRDGTGLKRITTGSAWEWDAVWAPDGTSIAYASGEGINVEYGDIWITPLDGGERIRVTKPDTYDYQADWQPVPE